MSQINKCKLATLMIIQIVYCSSIYASSKIAILDFELIDITSLPNTQEEIVRTASIKPLLEQTMSGEGAYKIIQIDTATHDTANPGVGYLFHFHDVAAKLGQQFGVDWIIVGQHSKISFLVSYLRVHVVDTHTEQLLASYNIELKGNNEKVTERSVNSLTAKIHSLLSEERE